MVKVNFFSKFKELFMELFFISFFGLVAIIGIFFIEQISIKTYGTNTLFSIKKNCIFLYVFKRRGLSKTAI